MKDHGNALSDLCPSRDFTYKVCGKRRKGLKNSKIHQGWRYTSLKCELQFWKGWKRRVVLGIQSRSRICASCPKILGLALAALAATSTSCSKWETPRAFCSRSGAVRNWMGAEGLRGILAWWLSKRNYRKLGLFGDTQWSYPLHPSTDSPLSASVKGRMMNKKDHWSSPMWCVSNVLRGDRGRASSQKIELSNLAFTCIGLKSHSGPLPFPCFPALPLPPCKELPGIL